MELLLEYHDYIIANFGPGMYILLGFLAVIGIVGQWMLYYKCDLPGVACLVPVWNVIVFLKIVGRPAWQSMLVMIPPLIMAFSWFFLEDSTSRYALVAVFGLLWLGFMVKVYIEICNSFGKTEITDYILCVLLNGFYVMYLGLSELEYKGYSNIQKANLSTNNQKA